MPRSYTVTLVGTVTAAGTDNDLIYIAPADDKPVEIIGFDVDITSEIAEAQEEWLQLKIVRGHATVGSGGAAITPQPLDPGDGAASFTARGNDTTIASAGTAVDLWAGGCNVRGGREKVFPPEAYRKCSQAQTTIVLRMTNTLADDVTANVTVDVIEH
jgi:ABC-type amino acid transport substrate-binding protein